MCLQGRAGQAPPRTGDLDLRGVPGRSGHQVVMGIEFWAPWSKRELMACPAPFTVDVGAGVDDVADVGRTELSVHFSAPAPSRGFPFVNGGSVYDTHLPKHEHGNNLAVSAQRQECEGASR